MSLKKIGALTSVLGILKTTSGTGGDVVKTLSKFGDLDSAAKYLVRSNNRGKSTLSQSVLFNLLNGAYGTKHGGSHTENEVSASLEAAMQNPSNKNITSSFALTGMLTSLKNAGSGLLTFLKPFLPVIIGTALVGLGYTGFKALDNKFDLTKGTTTKKYETAKEEHETAQSDLKAAQSEYDSNQDRIYELRAKANRTLDESQELNNLQDQNELLGAQVSLKEKIEKQKRIAEGDAALTDLNKEYNQKDYLGLNNEVNRGHKVSMNDMNEAQSMITYMQRQQDAYNTAKDNMLKRHNGELTEEDNNQLQKQQDRIDDVKKELSDKISDISDNAESLVDDEGKALKPEYQNTIDIVDSLIDSYSRLIGSASNTENKLNNLFALDKYSGLQTKLEGIGKSKGTAGILDVLNNDSSYTGLKTALEDKNVSLDDLAAYIMSIADPEKKNIEGIKANLKDEFSYNKKLNNFFKDKSDKDIEGFWDYYQNEGYDAEEYNWKQKDLSKIWDKYIESTKSAEPESATFASKFKNSAEDTATDLDTVTDNFQTDISNIKSAMDSLNSGEMKNSDLTDLIQQFPELAGETDNLQQGLQNLALDKASTAIRKIRDSVKDTTDPKELAQADRYIQSIMDNLNTSEFDMSNAKDNVITSFSSIFVLN